MALGLGLEPELGLEPGLEMELGLEPGLVLEPAGMGLGSELGLHKHLEEAHLVILLQPKCLKFYLSLLYPPYRIRLVRYHFY